MDTTTPVSELLLILIFSLFQTPSSDKLKQREERFQDEKIKKRQERFGVVEKPAKISIKSDMEVLLISFFKFFDLFF